MGIASQSRDASADESAIRRFKPKSHAKTKEGASMPTYNTPTPIDLAINVQVGRIDVIASDRTDTVVTVTPSSSTKAIDRRGVEQTKISFEDERLSIIGPKPRISWIGSGPYESVDVRVELPARSRLTAELAVGNVHTTGRLGATRIKASTGTVDVETTGDLWLRAGHGGPTVGTVDGGIDITAAYGQIRIGSVSGDALLKSSYGSIQVGESGGDLEAKLSYGDLEITNARGSVTAKTAFGAIQLAEVSSGSIQVDSGFGEITIGVRPGVPAWLDLSSKNGHVRNELAGDNAPRPTEETVSVRARTQGGDITIHRAR
jgi:Putative adhesin